MAILLDIVGVFEPRIMQIILANDLVPKYSLVFAVLVVYFVVIETLTGKSIGKYFTKTKVVDINGTKPSFGRIVLRSICRLIPFEMFSFLFFSGGGWHDSISKTRVVEDVK